MSQRVILLDRAVALMHADCLRRRGHVGVTVCEEFKDNVRRYIVTSSGRQKPARVVVVSSPDVPWVETIDEAG